MKILYGIQGTGHGHISRAREIVPLLAANAEVDVLISGYNCNMTLGDAGIIRKRGISLAYDESGGVACLKTVFQLKPVTFVRDVRSLEAGRYDLVISDYEPVTAWATVLNRVPSVALSHQASFLSKKSPRPAGRRSLLAEQILKKFAPCKHSVGFHFRRYDTFIEPPIIRRDVRHLTPVPGRHVTVYLPAFSHKRLESLFLNFPETEWHLFSPSCHKAYRNTNVLVSPIDNTGFLNSMKTGAGVVTSAGFETCAEAMFLGKKLMTIPIRNQYEQHCNAAALRQMGIEVVQTIEHLTPQRIENWLRHAPVIGLEEIADTERLTTRLIRYGQQAAAGSATVARSSPRNQPA